MRHKTLRMVAPGTPVTAREENDKRSLLNDVTQGINPPHQQLGRGSRVQLQHRRLVVVSIYDDYLICQEVDRGQAQRRVYYVAKPPMLRTSLSSHNGYTFTRTGVQARDASDGSTTESQSVVPAYASGDTIYAAGPLGDGTGVFDVPSTGQKVIWQDLNVDARVWATDPDE